MTGNQTAEEKAHTTDERFNPIEPFLDSDGDEAIHIECHRDYPDKHGLLWTGSTWLTVVEARRLREWLNRAIPTESEHG